MKKFISVFIAITLILSLVCVAPVSFAEDEKRVKFALATDLHIEKVAKTLPVSYPESELYFHASGSGNLYNEATGITLSFLSKAEKENVDFILIPGDLTRSGTKTEHEYVAKMLCDFSERTGIKIFAVPGNHDYMSSTAPDSFKKYYSTLCYENALVTDSETASYTADLPNDFRLIAVDSNNPGKDGDGLTERLFSWTDEQVKSAKADGKEVIFMMHHTVLEHLYLGSILMKDFIVRNHREVAERFCDWGIQYVFTGHEHGNDIAKYEGGNGNVLYDVLTTSLTSYPLEFRVISYGKSGVDIKMQSIDECDFSNLISGYNEKQLSLMESDYDAYAKGYFNYSIEKKILKYVSPEFINSKLKAENTPLSAAVDSLMSLVCQALQMPLYGEENSIEALAERYGVSIPESEYNSVLSLAVSLVAMHYYGDENLDLSSSAEGEILIKGLNTALEYILCNAESETEKALIRLSLGYFAPDSGKIDEWLTSFEDGSEESYEIAEEIIRPFLQKYASDTAPADRDVTLPAFGEKVSPLNRFFGIVEKIINFVEYILGIVFRFVK